MQKPFLFFLRQNQRVCFLGASFLAITSVLDALTPLFLKFIIDEIALKEKGRSFSESYFFIFLLGLSLSFLGLSRFGWGYYLARLTSSVNMQLKQKVFHSFTKINMYFFHKNRVGHLMNMLTEDVNHFCVAIGKGNLFALDVLFTVITIVPIMFYLSPSWAWKCLIFIPFIFFIYYLIAHQVAKRFQKQQKHLSDLSSHVVESISGIRIIKALGKEKFRLSTFKKQNIHYEKACNHTLGLQAILPIFSYFSTGIITLILLWFGSKDVISGAVTIGSLVAFQRYIHRLEWPIKACSMILSFYKKGSVSFSRLSSALDQKPDLIHKGKIKISGFHSFQVKNLSFTYPESQKPFLKNISFELNPGEKLALIGDNGSGKSTLLYLLARIWPAKYGTLFMNDVPFEEIEASSFYKTMTFITQKAFLFNDSIFNNIALGGKSLSPTMAQGLIHKTFLGQDIKKFPEQMKTLVGEEGLYLSSGQKERIALARGLFAETPLLLCDAPLSHVDYDTAHNIYKNLFFQEENKSMIFVLNNPIQLSHFDKILVLNEGEMEFFGTPLKANEQSSTYRHFYESLHTFTRTLGVTDREKSL